MKTLRTNLANKIIGAVSLVDGVGSKSISNRMLLFPLLLSKPITISHLLESEDTEIMACSIKNLGVNNNYGGRKLKFKRGRELSKHQHFFLGNSGTSARFLSSYLCTSSGNYFLRGSNRMHQRPFQNLVEGFRVLGATIKCQTAQHLMPMVIGAASTAHSFGDIKLCGNTSSQFVTAILFGVLLKLGRNPEPVSINIEGRLISKPYVSMTVSMLETLDVVIDNGSWKRLRVLSSLRDYYEHKVFAIETDMTSVSYFTVLTTASIGSVSVIGSPIFSLQGDAFFVSIIIKNNGGAVFADDGFTLLSNRTKVQPLKLDCGLIPDVAMTALVTSIFSLESFYCTKILSWRFKETDRVLAMAVELRKFGLVVESSLASVRAQKIYGAEINDTITVNTYNDHRMGMCFNIVCLIGVNLRIVNPLSVNKTLSNYFYIFNNLFG